MKQNIFIALSFCSFICICGAQESMHRSLSISFFDEQFSFPFESLENAQVHPGISISYDVAKRGKGVFSLRHIFQGGFYKHKGLNQVGYVSWKLALSWKIGNVIDIHAPIGLGYAHSFPTRDVFKHQGDGYQIASSAGKPHFMPSIGAGIGIDLDPIIDLPISLFVRYEIFSLAPYAPDGLLPFTINNMSSVGISYSIN